jgi:hypothetical protein
MAYLPTEAFWGLLPELRSGRIKYIEARFNAPRYGNGELTSLYFSKTTDSP